MSFDEYVQHVITTTVSLWASESAGKPIEELLGLPQHFVFLRCSPCSLNSQMLWALLFPVLIRWLGTPACGRDCLLLKGDLHTQDSLPILKGNTGAVGPVHSASLSLPPVSTWLLLYAFSYRCSVQLPFRWFSNGCSIL